MLDISNETVAFEESKEGNHLYGKTVSASFAQIERLPTIVIRALTEYKLGVLPSVSEEEYKELLQKWFSAPWKSEEEIEALREAHRQNKLNEWIELNQRSATSVSIDFEQSQSNQQKRQKVYRSI